MQDFSSLFLFLIFSIIFSCILCAVLNLCPKHKKETNYPQPINEKKQKNNLVNINLFFILFLIFLTYTILLFPLTFAYEGKKPLILAEIITIIIILGLNLFYVIKTIFLKNKQEEEEE